MAEKFKLAKNPKMGREGPNAAVTGGVQKNGRPLCYTGCFRIFPVVWPI